MSKNIKDKFNSNSNSKPAIAFSGGGTAGSVTPLINLAQTLAKQESLVDFSFIFFGSQKGIEREIVENSKLQLNQGGTNQINKPWLYLSIPAGKLRRYFSLANFSDIFRIISAFFVSWRLLKKHQVKILLSAGSFVSVPLAWAAYLQKIPVLIHQQDLRPGLANRLMAPFAQVITVTFEKSLEDYGSKAIWTGNPVKEELKQLKSREEVFQKYSLDPNKPLLLVTGGGTGSQALNNLIISARQEILTKMQIIHLSGKDKQANQATSQDSNQGYQTFEFLNQAEFLDLAQVADIVLSRAGLGALTEFSFLSKVVILIPMPKSHQEDNAQAFAQTNSALVLAEKDLNAQKLKDEIFNLLADKERQNEMKKNISQMIKTKANANIAQLILKLLKL